MSPLAVVLLLVAGFSAVLALPTCNPDTVNFNTDKVVLAVIGDWGRVGAPDSFFNPTTVAGCDAGRFCCSSSQNNNFPDDFDLTDQDDGPQQLAAASLMDEVCGKVGCQAVLGMGDNFYPCGADDPDTTNLNRFQSDWQNVYLTRPNLKNLKWYQIVGNHDYGFQGSVARQVNFSKKSKQWVLPERYYATKFAGKGFSMQLHSLDATPFVSSYVYPSPNYAYYHDEFIEAANPAYINSDAADLYYNTTTGLCTVPPANAKLISSISDTASGQIPWLKSCLSTSKATWNLVSSHFALWGSDQEYGNPTTSKYYPGLCGAWGSVQSLVNEYKVAMYVNGHDHTMTHSDPAHAGTSKNAALGYGGYSYHVNEPGATQYFTFGNGASLAYGDGVTLESPKSYNNFSSVIYNNNLDGSPGEGFGIVTITKCNMTVDLYSYINYQRESAPVHTVFIPGSC